MKTRERRVRKIELSLTPQQIVRLWLKNALQNGTFEEGAQHSPPYRGAVANAVYRNVQTSLKGQDETVIERATVQARQEADMLYSLVVNLNVRVMETTSQRNREYLFLLALLNAEMRAGLTKETAEILRVVFLMFIESVVILDDAIAQVALESLSGQPILFRDIAVKLEEQVRMSTDLSKLFNETTVSIDTNPINPEELRESLHSEIAHQATSWVHLARMEALSLFGSLEEFHAALGEGIRVLRSNLAEDKARESPGSR